MNFTLPEYTETIRQFEDSLGISYYAVKQLNYSTNLQINQPLPTDGNVYIRGGALGYDDMNVDIRSANLNTRIGFSQPLDAFYGYNTIRSTLKRAQLAYEQSSKSLKRSELNLVYQVSSAYYNLLSLQKSTEIAKLDMERQTEAFDISQNKYKAGLIREVDALQMEVDLAEAQNNYDIAILNQSSAVNSFKDLLGINLEDSISLSDELKYQIVIINTDKAVQLALKNRSEIKEQDIQIELQKLSLKQQKAQGMVKSNINAYFEKIGVSQQDINTNYPDVFNNSYKNLVSRPANYGVGFTISIPILDWGENRALVRASESRLKQTTLRKTEIEREIETEVKNLVAGVSSNLKRLQLLEKNVNVAEKSFEITLSRFSDGDIDSQSLALERNRLNTAYTSHLRAYINYQLALADLMRKTLYDFQNDVGVE
jgi:outer membrane protein TolC